jgi:hypothetical protein
LSARAGSPGVADETRKPVLAECSFTNRLVAQVDDVCLVAVRAANAVYGSIGHFLSFDGTRATRAAESDAGLGLLLRGKFPRSVVLVNEVVVKPLAKALRIDPELSGEINCSHGVDLAVRASERRPL